MHRYDRALLNEIHPAWLLAHFCIWVALFSMAFHSPSTHHEPGVRHALPDPYVPECYTIEWRSGSYCEFIPVKKGWDIAPHQ